MSGGKQQKRPLSKKTQTLIAELARRSSVRELEKRFLIVCEDDKSSVNYFKAIRKHFSLSATSLEVAGSGGTTQPIQVVEKAIELKTIAARPGRGTEPFAHVWCVIDGDYGIKIHNARAKAKRNRIELAISTMCFEYWLLLHFEETAKPTTCCDDLVSALRRRHMRKYEKGKCNFIEIVDKVHVACRRAEKLRKPGIDRGELPEDQNPCSEIYKLMNALLGPADRDLDSGSPPAGRENPKRRPRQA